MEEMFADPIVDDGEQDTVDIKKEYQRKRLLEKK